MRHPFRIVALFVVFFPLVGHAQVLLSEIAWMGSDADQNAEWIELYNFSETPTDLAGWVLEGMDSDVVLSGTLPPHGVGVLERGSDSTLPGDAFLIYNGELTDDGVTLLLKDMSGTVSDEATGGSGWESIGGSNTYPKKTVQRTRMGTWVTAAPTPGGANAQVSDPMVLGDATTTTSIPEESIALQSAHSGGSSGTGRKGLVLTMNASSTVYVEKQVSFSVVPGGVSKSKEQSLVYYWNFGDMTTGEGREVSHTYEFPGTYMVVGEASSTRQVVKVEKEVQVLPYPIALSESEERNVLISNRSETPILLDGYELRGEGYNFIFPRNSVLVKNGVVILSHTKVVGVKTLELRDTYGNVVAYLTRTGESKGVSVVETTASTTAKNILKQEGPLSWEGSTLSSPQGKKKEHTQVPYVPLSPEHEFYSLFTLYTPQYRSVHAVVGLRKLALVSVSN